MNFNAFHACFLGNENQIAKNLIFGWPIAPEIEEAHAVATYIKMRLPSKGAYDACRLQTFESAYSEAYALFFRRVIKRLKDRHASEVPHEGRRFSAEVDQYGDQVEIGNPYKLTGSTKDLNRMLEANPDYLWRTASGTIRIGGSQSAAEESLGTWGGGVSFEFEWVTDDTPSLMPDFD